MSLKHMNGTENYRNLQRTPSPNGVVYQKTVWCRSVWEGTPNSPAGSVDALCRSRWSLHRWCIIDQRTCSGSTPLLLSSSQCPRIWFWFCPQGPKPSLQAERFHSCSVGSRTHHPLRSISVDTHSLTPGPPGVHRRYWQAFERIITHSCPTVDNSCISLSVP